MWECNHTTILQVLLFWWPNLCPLSVYTTPVVFIQWYLLLLWASEPQLQWDHCISTLLSVDWLIKFKHQRHQTVYCTYSPIPIFHWLDKEMILIQPQIIGKASFAVVGTIKQTAGWKGQSIYTIWRIIVGSENQIWTRSKGKE